MGRERSERAVLKGFRREVGLGMGEGQEKMGAHESTQNEDAFLNAASPATSFPSHPISISSHLIQISTPDQDLQAAPNSTLNSPLLQSNSSTPYSTSPGPLNAQYASSTGKQASFQHSSAQRKSMQSHTHHLKGCQFWQVIFFTGVLGRGCGRVGVLVLVLVWRWEGGQGGGIVTSMAVAVKARVAVRRRRVDFIFLVLGWGGGGVLVWVSVGWKVLFIVNCGKGGGKGEVAISSAFLVCEWDFFFCVMSAPMAWETLMMVELKF